MEPLGTYTAPRYIRRGAIYPPPHDLFAGDRPSLQIRPSLPKQHLSKMIQTIAIEEACLHPGYTELSTRYTKGHSPIVDALCDIHGKRLDLMNEYGNEYQVLSLTSPGPQGETDIEKVPP
jgi:hypothetical protein